MLNVRMVMNKLEPFVTRNVKRVNLGLVSDVRKLVKKGWSTLLGSCHLPYAHYGNIKLDPCKSGYTTHPLTCTGNPVVYGRSQTLSSCPSGYQTHPLTCFRSIFDWFGRTISYGGCRDSHTVTALTCTAKTYSRRASCDKGVVSGLFCVQHARTEFVNYYSSPMGDNCAQEGYEKQGLLCYENPKDKYGCSTSFCYKQCPAEKVDCGLGCGSSSADCGTAIASMVFAPIEIAVNALTGGAATKIKNAIKIGTKAASGGFAAADFTVDNVQRYLDLSTSREGFTNRTSVEIEQAIADRFGRGSPNYNKIAKEWSATLIYLLAQKSLEEANILLASIIDPTGVIGAIDAYAKPLCGLSSVFPV